MARTKRADALQNGIVIAEGSEDLCSTYTKALGRRIIQMVEEGHCIKEICEIMKPQGFPSEKTVYRWKKKYPEFKQGLADAYQDLIFKMMDEANVLSKESLSLDRDINEIERREQSGELSSKEAIAEVKYIMAKNKERREAIKIRLKNIEFMLNRIAPKLVNDLKDVQQSAVPQHITIVNYSKTPKSIDVLDQGILTDDISDSNI